MGEGMAHVGEPNKCKALSLNPVLQKFLKIKIVNRSLYFHIVYMHKSPSLSSKH
jgi:hypothetical protein